MRRITFESGEYYHIYNRGVDKRTIFLDRRDFERFLYLLFACNDTEPLLNSQFYYRGFASIEKYPRKRTQLVDILCFCLMPNHFHLILRQRVDSGISLFMQKLGTGYTMYFNIKYKRSGVLFQGVFKAIHIDREEYLTHLTRYIHLNPAELREPQWKKQNIRNRKTILEFVKKYPWSSYQYYLERKRFAPLLATGLIKELFLPPQEYEKFVSEWVPEHADLLSGYIIED